MLIPLALSVVAQFTLTNNNMPLDTSRKIIIGFGTGRCGTKSLAEFLNKQPGLNVTHEGVALGWYPALADTDVRLNAFLKREGDIGDVGFYWVHYLDLIFHRHQGAKAINLIRDDEEVVASFWNHLGENESTVGWHGYPFDSPNWTKDAVRFMVKRYRYIESELYKTYPFSIYRLPMQALNSKREMGKLLDWLGVSPDNRVLEAIHFNKGQERKQKVRNFWNGLEKGRLFIRRSKGGKLCRQEDS